MFKDIDCYAQPSRLRGHVCLVLSKDVAVTLSYEMKQLQLTAAYTPRSNIISFDS